MTKQVVLFVVFLAGTLILASCGPFTEPYWEAVYCSREGCPEGSREVVRSNLLRNEETCPSTKRIQTGSIQVGDFSVPIYKTYFLKEDTCRKFYPTPVEQSIGNLFNRIGGAK